MIKQIICNNCGHIGNLDDVGNVCQNLEGSFQCLGTYEIEEWPKQCWLCIHAGETEIQDVIYCHLNNKDFAWNNICKEYEESSK